MNKKEKLTIDKEVEEAAIKAVENFGAPKDMYHPDYGWIVRFGKCTEAGELFYKHLQEKRDDK